MKSLQARRFARILEQHRDSLQRLARRLTGNADDAEDLFQDLVERVTPRMAEVVRLERPQPWLARVLYRLFVDRWRQQQVRPDTDPDADVEVQPDHRDLPDDQFERALTAQRLEAALQRLSPHLRDVVVLHDVEGYTLNEIRVMVDTPIGTLKSRLHRGRARLRELLVDGTFPPSHS